MQREPDSTKTPEALTNHPIASLSQVPDAVSASQAKSLAQLPYDVNRTLFDYLTPVHSACLGITCKALYSIHKQLYPKLSLFERAWGRDFEDDWYNVPQLADLLRTWMLPAYIWNNYRNTYTPWRLLNDDIQMTYEWTSDKTKRFVRRQAEVGRIQASKEKSAEELAIVEARSTKGHLLYYDLSSE